MKNDEGPDLDLSELVAELDREKAQRDAQDAALAEALGPLDLGDTPEAPATASNPPTAKPRKK
jgi:hypothetical protein